MSDRDLAKTAPTTGEITHGERTEAKKHLAEVLLTAMDLLYILEVSPQTAWLHECLTIFLERYLRIEKSRITSRFPI